jgi:hypothetical protein
MNEANKCGAGLPRVTYVTEPDRSTDLVSRSWIGSTIIRHELAEYSESVRKLSTRKRSTGKFHTPVWVGAFLRTRDTQCQTAVRGRRDNQAVVGAAVGVYRVTQTDGIMEPRSRALMDTTGSG